MPSIKSSIASALLALTVTAFPATAQPKSEVAKDADVEKAVQLGFEWLARKQEKDGGWSFDGTSKDRWAATGMALLPFLNAGEGPTKGLRYRNTVKKGTDWLIKSVQTDGKIGNGMYAQAIATMALCNSYYLSPDVKLLEATTNATKYIIAAQARNGSWGYSAREPGDTSIVHWQIQALFAAERAGITFNNKKTFKLADEFLVSVSTDSGAKYGYREKGASQTLTPDGLVSRCLMGTLTPASTAFVKGVAFLKNFPPQDRYFDTYYYLSATNVMAAHGGDDWQKSWKPKIRELLLKLQCKTEGESDRGSWSKDEGFIGSACGRLGTTAFSLLTLEVVSGYSLRPGDEGLIPSEERLKKQIEEQLKKLKK